MKNTVYIGWAKTRTKGEFITEFYPVLTILHDRVSTTLLSQLLFKNELHAISTKISFCSTPIQFQLLKPQHNYKLTHKYFFFFWKPKNTIYKEIKCSNTWKFWHTIFPHTKILTSKQTNSTHSQRALCPLTSFLFLFLLNSVS